MGHQALLRDGLTLVLLVAALSVWSLLLVGLLGVG